MANNELVHYGVKGMKWGVTRKKAPEPKNKDYKSHHRREDSLKYGKRGVQRINTRMNKGETREQAQKREELRDKRQRRTATGALIAARLYVQFGHVIVPTAKALGQVGAALVENAVGNQNRKNNAKANRNAAADSRGLPSKPSSTPYSKRSRSRVYKVTTL